MQSTKSRHSFENLPRLGIVPQRDVVLHENHDDRYPTLLITFPRYTKNEIVALSLAAVKLPAGITRHLISGRARRTNIGLEILRSHAPLKSKNARLRDIIRQMVVDKKVRFYGEPTFLFDE